MHFKLGAQAHQISGRRVAALHKHIAHQLAGHAVQIGQLVTHGQRRVAEVLAGEIEDPSTRESAGLAANAPIEVTHRLQRIGESRSAGKDGTAIYAAIFGLTLGAANADAAAGATAR